MSNTNETHDQGCLDNNLDRLLELGEPAPGMPEDLKARIRSKLTEAGRDSVKKRILPSRWAMWPVAATIIAAVILIVLWYGNSSKAIAWADVQGRLNQVHTMTQCVPPQSVGDRTILYAGGDIHRGIRPAFGCEAVKLSQHCVALTHSRGVFQENPLLSAYQAGDGCDSDESELCMVLPCQPKSLKDRLP